jgi:hypothetical protein
MTFDIASRSLQEGTASRKSESRTNTVSARLVSRTAERLRPGDQVVLRAPEEILATLDASGACKGVPFMPEMLRYYGRAFTVAKRVEKICDTICPTGSRRMQDCVYLEDLRCDGSAHGSCEAECRIYWKEDWLVRLTPDARILRPDAASIAALTAVIAKQIHQPGQPALFRCQVTEARRATTALPGWDLRQYAREVTSGNVTVGKLLRVALRAIPYEVCQAAREAIPDSLRPLARWVRGKAQSRLAPRERLASLNLQPGDWVEVRSAEEIKQTLNARGYNRGLLFSAPEMMPACGKRFRVRRRVGRIIDEPTGRMLQMKHDCIVLEGQVCAGDRSVRRWFCGREIYPFWREAWLKRVDGPAPMAGHGATEEKGRVAASGEHASAGSRQRCVAQPNVADQAAAERHPPACVDSRRFTCPEAR